LRQALLGVQGVSSALDQHMAQTDTFLGDVAASSAFGEADVEVLIAVLSGIALPATPATAVVAAGLSEAVRQAFDFCAVCIPGHVVNHAAFVGAEPVQGRAAFAGHQDAVHAYSLGRNAVAAAGFWLA